MVGDKYKVISNPSEHIGKLCHVEGWRFGCVFRLIQTDGRTHTLITPKSGKRYFVTKLLLYTRAQIAEMEGAESG
jgi:hypothetical protein